MSKQAGHPRLAIPAIPLIGLLCALAGSVDAAAYLLCGHLFVANMTGNTVLLAISLLQRNPKEAALRAGMVAAFLAGVIVARLLARTAAKRPTKTQRVFILGIESLLLLLLAWKNAGAHTDLLLLLLACMLGMQNGAFQYIGGFRLNTTFVTGDLEKLGEAMTGTRDALPKTTTFLLSWIAYAGGACLGALNALNLPHHGFLVSTILAVASLIAVSLMPDLAERSREDNARESRAATASANFVRMRASVPACYTFPFGWRPHGFSPRQSVEVRCSYVRCRCPGISTRCTAEPAFGR